MRIEKYIDSDGQILDVDIGSRRTKFYINNNGEYHRLDGPAIKYKDGSYEWYKNNFYHHMGGPAYYDVYWNEIEWWVDEKKVMVYYICG